MTITTKITITDRFIYNLIKSYTKNDKPFFASNNYLAKELNRSISVISHSISRLLKLEYLENRGNKMCRQLYAKNDLLSADFDIKNANNSKESAENSISLKEFKREYAKNSTNKMLKTAIESAENSNILISILLSYTNKYIYSKEDLKNKKENMPFLDLVKEVKENNIKEIAEEIYFIYALKKGKAEGIKKLISYLQKSKNVEVEVEKIKNHIENYNQSCKKDNYKFMKHFSSYVNQEPWNDEVIVETKKESKIDLNICIEDIKKGTARFEPQSLSIWYSRGFTELTQEQVKIIQGGINGK